VSGKCWEVQSEQLHFDEMLLKFTMLLPSFVMVIASIWFGFSVLKGMIIDMVINNNSRC